MTFHSLSSFTLSPNYKKMKIRTFLLNAFEKVINDYKFRPSLSSRHKAVYFNVSGEIEAERITKIFQFLTDKNLMPEDTYRQLEDGSIVDADDAFICEHCDEAHHNDNSASVITTGRRNRYESEIWCESCREHHSFYCTHSGNVFSDENFSAIQADGDMVCQEHCEQDLYYNEDGEASFELWEEDEDEETEEEVTGRVSSYHGSPKPWEHRVYTGDVFGCELELDAKNSKNEVAGIAQSCGLSAENDGSLGSMGVEIIGAPWPLHEIRSSSGAWMRFLDKVRGKAQGWQSGTGYGLHVSINRSAMTHLHQGKMLHFFHRNKSLCENVAGRSEVHWAKYKSARKITDAAKGSGGDMEKYEALSIRSETRIECRIFRSTLSHAGFLRAVEFVAAAVDFTRQTSIKHLSETCFRQWLEMPHNRASYPFISFHLNLDKVFPKEREKGTKSGNLNTSLLKPYLSFAPVEARRTLGLQAVTHETTRGATIAQELIARRKDKVSRMLQVMCQKRQREREQRELRERLENVRPLIESCGYRLVTVEEWNSRYPDYESRYGGGETWGVVMEKEGYALRCVTHTGYIDGRESVRNVFENPGRHNATVYEWSGTRWTQTNARAETTAEREVRLAREEEEARIREEQERAAQAERERLVRMNALEKVSHYQRVYDGRFADALAMLPGVTVAQQAFVDEYGAEVIPAQSPENYVVFSLDGHYRIIAEEARAIRGTAQEQAAMIAGAFNGTAENAYGYDATAEAYGSLYPLARSMGPAFPDLVIVNQLQTA